LLNYWSVTFGRLCIELMRRGEISKGIMII